MTNLGDAAAVLKAGEKIAQMIPVPVLTGTVEEVRVSKTRRGRTRVWEFGG
jgi:dUTPase